MEAAADDCLSPAARQQVRRGEAPGPPPQPRGVAVLSNRRAPALLRAGSRSSQRCLEGVRGPGAPARRAAPSAFGHSRRLGGGGASASEVLVADGCRRQRTPESVWSLRFCCSRKRLAAQFGAGAGAATEPVERFLNKVPKQPRVAIKC